MKKPAVLITGASNGLGAALARAFAEISSTVVIHGRNLVQLKELSLELQNRVKVAPIVRGDIRLRETVAALASAAAKHEVSMLVNCAGMPCPGLPLTELEEETVDDLLAVNLLAPVALTRAVLPQFLARGAGVVVNLNSIVGREAKLNRSVYSAARWGLRGFTDSLRLECAPQGVQVIGVYISRVRTKPEYEYGMDPAEVAQKIVAASQDPTCVDLILDGRPAKAA